MAGTPDLITVITDAIRYHLGEVNTAIPARILKYDPDRQEAEIQPLIKRRYKDGRVVDRAPITGVPVVFPSAGGGIITFPVQRGDTVLAIFSQRSIDRWVQGNGGPIDPQDNRKHDISDAIAIPGLFSFPSALKSDPENVIIKFSGASIALTPQGAIEIEAPGGLIVNGNTNITGDVAATGDIEADGDIDADGEVTANASSLFVTLTGHLHPPDNTPPTPGT